MKNILYIGPYKENNGTGQSSRRWVNCFSSNSNINLKIHPVFFTTSSINLLIDENIYKKYENNQLDHYDYVIQHGHPEMFVYDKRFGINIGIVEIETRSIYRSGWKNQLNLMDEIWVNSTNAIFALEEIGVTKPILFKPEPYDLMLYKKSYDPFFTDKSVDSPFVFYTIGSYNEKKNIKNIILAYLLEFNKRDNVRLFIKTDHYKYDPHSLEIILKNDIEDIKMALRKNTYCDIDFISGRVSDVDIIRLHQSGDCYVNACRADGCAGNSIEAMLSDSVVISTKNIGSSTYFNSSNALMVDSIPCNVFSSHFLNKNILTIYEEWDDPNITSLQTKMREAYYMSQKDKEKIIKNYNKNLFDYKNMDNIL